MSVDTPASGITPLYWGEACVYLAKNDRIMRRLIKQYPNVSLTSKGDAFKTLARFIVQQQVSAASAQKTWNRLVTFLKNDSPTPKEILCASFDDLSGVGLSKRKIEYLHDLAFHFAEGVLIPEAWSEMDDEAVIKELMNVRGIGRLTAELFLIFHLLRPNVFPLDDVGLMKGISQNYFSGEPVTRVEARELADIWSPYRTVAIWYLWHSLDPIPVSY